VKAIFQIGSLRKINFDGVLIMSSDNADNIIYRKNQLINVICQLRFPRILSINENAPAEFQDKIRDNYPLYNMLINKEQQLTFDPSNKLPSIFSAEDIKNHVFSSEDGVWTIDLTSTYLSLTTSQYPSWESYKKRLLDISFVLLSVYKPAYFERIGIRYINAFRRSLLDLDAVDWRELIEPFALGFMSSTEYAKNIIGYQATTEIDIGNNAIARIVTSTGYIANVIPQNSLINTALMQNPELAFIVDNDFFFNTKKQNDELNDSLEKLHKNSSVLIRSVITDKLHQAMEPMQK
jgi:uncharacterized protein (TIGR04255 family)